MKVGPQADAFGEFLMTKLRDEAIDFFDGLATGGVKSPRTAALRTALASMTPEQRDVTRRAVVAAVDHGLHAFLFALDEGGTPTAEVVVTVDGQNVVDQSDGVYGELFGDQGWFARHSRHGAGPD